MNSLEKYIDIRNNSSKMLECDRIESIAQLTQLILSEIGLNEKDNIEFKKRKKENIDKKIKQVILDIYDLETKKVKYISFENIKINLKRSPFFVKLKEILQIISKKENAKITGKFFDFDIDTDELFSPNSSYDISVIDAYYILLGIIKILDIDEYIKIVKVNGTFINNNMIWIFDSLASNEKNLKLFLLEKPLKKYIHDDLNNIIDNLINMINFILTKETSLNNMYKDEEELDIKEQEDNIVNQEEKNDYNDNEYDNEEDEEDEEYEEEEQDEQDEEDEEDYSFNNAALRTQEQKEENQNTQIQSNQSNQNNQNEFNLKIDEMTDYVKQMMPNVQETLKMMMNFEENLKSNILVTYAKTYIELYILINDLYESNKNIAIKIDVNHRNYVYDNYVKNIKNYEMLKETIVDTLENFGVEEIKSIQNSQINLKTSNILNEDDYNVNSKVKQSIRSGFILGDIVLLKEDIIVDN